MNSAPDSDEYRKQEAINDFVIRLEAFPRHQWRREATSLVNRIEQNFSGQLHKGFVERLSFVKEELDNGIIALIEAAHTLAKEKMNLELSSLQKVLKGYRFIEQMLVFHENLSLQEAKRSEVLLKARFHKYEHTLISSIQKGFKVIYKEKWIPEKIREEFIETVIKTEHGGQSPAPFHKLVDSLLTMIAEIESATTELIKACQFELRKEIKDAPDN